MAAEFAIQKALYDALTALGLTVFDSAPQVADGGSAASWPRVEVGFINLAPFDTYSELGFNCVARIHTRSRSAGMKEAKEIQGQIYARLHRGDLTIVGHRLIEMHRLASDVTRAGDGSFHGVCEYRALIETV